MKQASGPPLCPWRAAVPLLAAAALIPCVDSGDPLGRETPRIVVLQAAALLACLLAGPARPRFDRSGLGIWLAPLLLGALFLAGLRDRFTLAAGLPLVFAAALAVPAAAAGTRRIVAVTLLGTVATAAAVVAAWGVFDGLQGGAGVGPLGNANRVGEYVVTALPAALACYLVARHRVLAVAGLAATALLFALAVICKSRGGLVTGAIEVVVLTTAAGGLRRIGLLSTAPWRRSGALALVGLLLLGTAWIVPPTRPHVERAFIRLGAGLSAEYPANRVRLGLVRGTAALAAAHPLGVGAGRFGAAFVEYRDPIEHRTSGWKSTVTHAHNQYLHAAAETGWAGALLFTALAWVTAILLLRRISHTAEPAGRLLRMVGGTAFIGAGVVSLFGTPLLNPAALTNLALLGGAAAGARAGPGAFRRGRVLAVAGAIALASAAMLTIPVLRSHHERSSVFAARTPAALEASWARAVDADPEDADAWQHLAHVQARTARRDAALASFLRAIAARPQFPNGLLAAADLYAAAGDYPEALARVEEARRLQPWNPHPYYLAGKILLAGGHGDRGCTALERAIAADRAAAPEGGAPPSAVAIAARDTLTTHLLQQAEATERAAGRSAAADTYRRILVLDPDHPDANLRLGLQLRRDGKVEEARRLRYRGHLQRGLRLLRTLVERKRRRGEPAPPAAYEKVLASLVRAHENAPENAAPFYYMAVTRIVRGRDDTPWNDAEQVPAALAEARRRGLTRLEEAPDAGEFRSLVAPSWK